MLLKIGLSRGTFRLTVKHVTLIGMSDGQTLWQRCSDQEKSTGPGRPDSCCALSGPTEEAAPVKAIEWWLLENSLIPWIWSCRLGCSGRGGRHFEQEAFFGRCVLVLYQGTTLQLAEELIFLKGTAFRPYIARGVADFSISSAMAYVNALQ